MSLSRRLKNIARSIPGFRGMDRYLCYRYTGWYVPERFPRGHFYSPLPGYREVNARRNQLFEFRADTDLKAIPGLDAEREFELVAELGRFRDEFNWPARQDAATRFHLGQSFFMGGDAFALYALVRHFRPRRIVEIGSGHSSALMLDVADRHLQKDFHLTCIEPHPERLHDLIGPDPPAACSVLEKVMQDVPLQLFEELERNDILFVDSSHVSKVGSDVNRLVFEILPSLAKGVVIHFHDVFWPFEYPEEWVMDGRGWNEAYVLRAFLQYNRGFEVMLWASHLAARFPERLSSALPELGDCPGGSLWLRRA